MHAVHHPYIRHWLRHVDVQISSRDRFQGLSRIFSSITSFCVRVFLLIWLPQWNRNTFLNKLFESRLTTTTLRMVLVKLPFFDGRFFCAFRDWKTWWNIILKEVGRRTPGRFSYINHAGLYRNGASIRYNLRALVPWCFLSLLATLPCQGPRLGGERLDQETSWRSSQSRRAEMILLGP